MKRCPELPLQSPNFNQLLHYQSQCISNSTANSLRNWYSVNQFRISCRPRNADMYYCALRILSALHAFNPYPYIVFHINFNIILSSCLRLPSGLSSLEVFRPQILPIHLPIFTTLPTTLLLLSTNREKFGKYVCKCRSSSVVFSVPLLPHPSS